MSWNEAIEAAVGALIDTVVADPDAGRDTIVVSAVVAMRALKREDAPSEQQRDPSIRCNECRRLNEQARVRDEVRADTVDNLENLSDLVNHDVKWHVDNEEPGGWQVKATRVIVSGDLFQKKDGTSLSVFTKRLR